MLAQWCFTAWNIAIGRPNCRRSFAYAAAMLGALARDADRLGGQDHAGEVDEHADAAPGSTVAGAPSSVTRADRRVGSRFGGTSTFTPSPRVDHGDVVARRRRAARRRARRRGRCRRCPTPCHRRRVTIPRARPRPSPSRPRDRAAARPATAPPTAVSTALDDHRRHERARRDRPPSSSTTTTSSSSP